MSHNNKKISELPLATTPLAGTEEQEIVQGGVNKRVAVSEVGGNSGAWGSITGTLSDQTDLNSALGLKAALASPALTGTPTVNGAGVAPGLVPAATTGTAVAFAVPQIYGTPASPQTGNITLTTTGLIVGVIQKMYHNNATAPTFGAEFVKLSGNYVESTLNIIHFEAYSTSRIEYTVTQEI